VSTLVVQRLEQPGSVHEVHGSIPKIMNFFQIVLYLYIPMMNKAIMTNTEYVHCMSVIHTNNLVNTLYVKCMYKYILSMYLCLTYT
jgi:hypothetical protein